MRRGFENEISIRWTMAIILPGVSIYIESANRNANVGDRFPEICTARRHAVVENEHRGIGA